MTRARALKRVIRDRADKTGERYTTARRHVLRDLKIAAPPTKSAPSAQATSPARPTSPVKGGLSDAKAREKTGHGLDYWFAVLDRFGAVEKGHTAAARHLYENHHVPGWHSQGITVAYERARGVRAANQRCDGEFEVSVSKVVNADVPAIVKAFTDARLRKQWTANVDPDLANSLTAAVSGKTSSGFVVRPDGLGRFRYKWGDTTVQFYLIPKKDKTSIVVTHAKLADGNAVEERRAEWKVAFAALAAQLQAR